MSKKKFPKIIALVIWFSQSIRELLQETKLSCLVVDRHVASGISRSIYFFLNLLIKNLMKSPSPRVFGACKKLGVKIGKLTMKLNLQINITPLPPPPGPSSPSSNPPPYPWNGLWFSRFTQICIFLCFVFLVFFGRSKCFWWTPSPYVCQGIPSPPSSSFWILHFLAG